MLDSRCQLTDHHADVGRTTSGSTTLGRMTASMLLTVRFLSPLRNASLSDPCVYTIFPPASYVSQIQKNGNTTFFEAQAALARIWLGETPGTPTSHAQTKVRIKIPEPTKVGAVEAEKEEADKKVDEFPLPETVKEAQAILRRFENGARSVRGNEDVADSVAEHVLHDRKGLLDEQWLGTEEEELSA